MEKNIKNNILTISGEPASGKSTVIKELIKNYEEHGFNVHIFSIGDIFRKMAQEKGLSIEKFNEYVRKREDVDKIIDSKVKEYGERINSKERQKDVYVFDSRLAWYNIPSSFSIRLTANSSIAGERAFHDPKRGAEDKYSTLENAIHSTEERKRGEVARYKERYGIDLEDQENYDLIIDTSYSTINDIANTILLCNEKYREGKHFGKNWASPKIFLPLQTERDTLAKGTYVTMDEILESIKNNGYNPEEEIETIKVDGRYYIIEGHHRNFGAALAKKTLIPYTVIAKDDESIPWYGGSKARDRSLSIRFSYLTGHEWMIGDNFSYDEIYPGIHEQLRQDNIAIGR